MAKYSDKFLQKTIAIWQPYSPVLLTMEDASEIADNMLGLYTYLLELKQKHDKEEKNI